MSPSKETGTSTNFGLAQSCFCRSHRRTFFWHWFLGGGERGRRAERATAVHRAPKWHRSRKPENSTKFYRLTWLFVP